MYIGMKLPAWLITIVYGMVHQNSVRDNHMTQCHLLFVYPSWLMHTLCALGVCV